MINNDLIVPPNESLKFGDIIFVSNLSSVGGKLTDIRQGRKSVKIDDKKVKPTHVAIAWGQGNIIFHAITKGLKFSAVPKYINGKQIDKGDVFVFRNELLAKQAGNLPELLNMRNFISGYFGKKYNNGVIFKWKSLSERKFCSELAAEFLMEFGYLNKKPKAARYLPIHLLKVCAGGGNWEQVNIDYGFMYDKKRITNYYDNVISKLTDKSLIASFEIHRKIALENADLISNSELKFAHIENSMRRSGKEFAKMREDIRKANAKIKSKK